jgi:hypothetical protein
LGIQCSSDLLKSIRDFPRPNSKGIADVKNPRLQRLMMKMLPYTFTAEWIKGKDHLAADALSRFPVNEPCLEDELCESHAEAAVNRMFTLLTSPLLPVSFRNFSTINKPMIHS